MVIDNAKSYLFKKISYSGSWGFNDKNTVNVWCVIFVGVVVLLLVILGMAVLRVTWLEILVGLV